MKAHVRLTLSLPLTEAQTKQCLSLIELSDPDGADFEAAMKAVEAYVADDWYSLLDNANVLEVEADAVTEPLFSDPAHDEYESMFPEGRFERYLWWVLYAFLIACAGFVVYAGIWL